MNIQDLSILALRDYVEKSKTPEARAWLASQPCGDQDAYLERVEDARVELERREKAFGIR